MEGFEVVPIEKEREEFFVLKITCKATGKVGIFISCYISPGGGTLGAEVSNVLGYLLCKIYQYWDADLVVLCGDFNGRLGRKQDCLFSLDDIRPRTHVDQDTNKHGTELLDFLTDSVMCTLNGRFCPDRDNYTYIKGTGKSVVDYIIVPQDNLALCNDFYVETARDLINRYNIQNTLESTLPKINRKILSLSPNFPVIGYIICILGK